MAAGNLVHLFFQTSAFEFDQSKSICMVKDFDGGGCSTHLLGPLHIHDETISQPLTST